MASTAWHHTARCLTRVSQRCPYALLASWGLVVACCTMVAPRLVDVLDLSISGADDSPATHAQELASYYFRPSIVPNGTHPNGTHRNGSKHSVLNPSAAFIYVESAGDLLEDPQQLLWTITNLTKQRYPNRVSGYWSLQDQPKLAEVFLSRDRHSSFLSVYPAYDVGQDMIDFVSGLREELPFRHLFLGAAGEAVITAEAAATAASDVGHCDLIVLPAALLALMWMLGSWRLLVISLLNFVASSALAFAGVYAIVTLFSIDVVILAPALMSTMLVAVGIDYSLFLLTRFVEEFESQCTFEKAVERSLFTSGHTILGSGATLAICFGALTLFPVPFLASLGYATVLTIASTIVTNLCLTPVLLFCAPSFFNPENFKCCVSSCSDHEARDDGCGRRLATATTHPVMTAVVLASIALLVWRLLPLAEQIEPEGELSQLLPDGSMSKQTIQRALGSFPQGIVRPYLVLLLPPATRQGNDDMGAVFEETFWESARAELVRVTAEFPQHGMSSILSPMYISGTQHLPLDLLSTKEQIDLFQLCHESFDPSRSPWPGVPCEPGVKCCTAGKDCCTKGLTGLPFQTYLHSLGLNVSHAELLSVVQDLRSVLDETVNYNGTAVRALLVADVAPGSAAGCDFARSARKALAAKGGRGMLGGGDADFVDVIDAIVVHTPTIMLVAAAVVLLLVGLLYRSVMIPLRSVVTISFTVISSLALEVAIYQLGSLRGLGPGPWAPAGGIICVLPPLAIALVLGLALDYDVFLVGRMVELHDSGLPDKDCIVLGAWKSGRVITAAGVIMAIAFSGLLMSKIPALNMLGTLLIAAVLLDTFVMRTLVTPALMAPLGRLNWLPRAARTPVVQQPALLLAERQA